MIPPVPNSSIVGKVLHDEVFLGSNSLLNWIKQESDEVLQDFSAINFRDWAVRNLEIIIGDIALNHQGLPSSARSFNPKDYE